MARRSAHKLARTRRYTKPTGIVLKNAHIRAYGVGGLRARWSPEQIAGRLPLRLILAMTMSHEAIYLYVYEQARRNKTDALSLSAIQTTEANTLVSRPLTR